MNEQIRKIALETDAWCDQHHMGNQSYNIEWEQKFAELIVRECAKVILETPVDYMETDTMHRIRDSVKQHFGVEE